MEFFLLESIPIPIAGIAMFTTTPMSGLIVQPCHIRAAPIRRQKYMYSPSEKEHRFPLHAHTPAPGSALGGG